MPELKESLLWSNIEKYCTNKDYIGVCQYLIANMPEKPIYTKAVAYKANLLGELKVPPFYTAWILQLIDKYYNVDAPYFTASMNSRLFTEQHYFNAELLSLYAFPTAWMNDGRSRVTLIQRLWNHYPFLVDYLFKRDFSQLGTVYGYLKSIDIPEKDLLKHLHVGLTLKHFDYDFVKPYLSFRDHDERGFDIFQEDVTEFTINGLSPEEFIKRGDLKVTSLKVVAKEVTFIHDTDSSEEHEQKTRHYIQHVILNIPNKTGIPYYLDVSQDYGSPIENCCHRIIREENSYTFEFDSVIPKSKLFTHEKLAAQIKSSLNLPLKHVLTAKDIKKVTYLNISLDFLGAKEEESLIDDLVKLPNLEGMNVMFDQTDRNDGIFHVIDVSKFKRITSLKYIVLEGLEEDIFINASDLEKAAIKVSYEI